MYLLVTSPIASRDSQPIEYFFPTEWLKFVSERRFSPVEYGWSTSSCIT